jgi:excisionase family DNA binding protein
MTANDVAGLLQVQSKTVLEWVRQRKIPARHFGKLVRFVPSDVEAFIERARV